MGLGSHGLPYFLLGGYNLAVFTLPAGLIAYGDESQDSGQTILEITILLQQKDINVAVNRKDPRGCLLATAFVVHCPRIQGAAPFRLACGCEIVNSAAPREACVSSSEHCFHWTSLQRHRE